MNKYSVALYSRLNDETKVSIRFEVNTPMTEKQLKTFYECKSLSISDVIVMKMD